MGKIPRTIRLKLEELGIRCDTQQRLKELAELKLKGLRKCFNCGEISQDNLENFYGGRKCKKCLSMNQKIARELMTTNKSFERLFYKKIPLIKDRAIRNNWEFNIDKDFLLELLNKQQYKCYYTGESLSASTNNDYTASIDRIDSSKGYTKDNVVICLKIANIMKWELSQDQFYNICEKIVKTHSNILKPS